MKSIRWSASVIALALVACAGDDGADDQAAADSAAVAPAPAATPAPAAQIGDAEIAHIATTANTLDVDGGNLAKGKAQGADVKAFAQRMIDEHTKSNEEATALAQSLGLTPADNPNSQQMKTEHEQAKPNLESLSGAEFDKAYIAHEVQMHQKVLDALDQQLIPNAQNQQLKDLLTKARTMVNSHLEQARNIQTKLGT